MPSHQERVRRNYCDHEFDYYDENCKFVLKCRKCGLEKEPQNATNRPPIRHTGTNTGEIGPAVTRSKTTDN